MGKILDRFTDPGDANAPRYQFDGETVWLLSPICMGASDKIYVECEDRLSRHGVWLHWGPPYVPTAKYFKGER